MPRNTVSTAIKIKGHNFNLYHSDHFIQCKCGTLIMIEEQRPEFHIYYHCWVKGASGRKFDGEYSTIKNMPSCHEVKMQQLLK